MRAAELTQAHRYRIEGVEGSPDRLWHYIGTLEGVARFLDGTATAVMLHVDQLTELGPAHLSYEGSYEG
jgi:hypothetical protein